MRRRTQFLSLKETIKVLRPHDLETKTFAELREILTNAGRLDRNVDEGRQVAMLMSYVRGNTTDEDARWHIW